MDALSPVIDLWSPRSPHDWAQARKVLQEYAASLGVDLSFQDFEGEWCRLEEVYGQERSVFMLASVDGALAGCCAVRPLQDSLEANACEMKRLYVRPAFRGFGLGRAMAESLLQWSREAGFSVMLLDALSDMEAARELYTSLGFEPTDPYYYNPLPGAHYFRIDLDATVSRY